jgi:hypothetical protein
MVPALIRVLTTIASLWLTIKLARQSPAVIPPSLPAAILVFTVPACWPFEFVISFLLD